MAYATVNELRDTLGKTGTGDDGVFELLIAGAEDAINNYCNRPDGFVAVTTAAARYFNGSGKPWMRIDECVSITTVSVKDAATDDTYTDWTSDDWIPFSGDVSRPDFNHLPYDGLIVDPNGSYSHFTSGLFVGRGGFKPIVDVPRGTPTVKVTARWGYAASVPDQIKVATLALTSRWWKQGRSAWADTTAVPELGQLLYMRENSDIRMMLNRFKVPAIG